MTPSTVRLKQLAEKLIQYDHSPLVHPLDRSDFKLAANPEAVLGLIARIEKLEAALEHIAKIDTCSTQPDVVWLRDWRNDTKRFASEALKDET